MIAIYTKVGTATARSQQDSNFRLEEKLRDTNQWRAELQGEVHNIKMTVLIRVMRVISVMRVIRVMRVMRVIRVVRNTADNILQIMGWGSHPFLKQIFEIMEKMSTLARVCQIIFF